MGNQAAARNRTAFGFATQKQAIDYANEALDLARKDLLILQRKMLTSFELATSGRGDFGTQLLETVDAHARTLEFGRLLWDHASIGRAVLELVQREIEAREAQRPHRRAIAWLKGVLGIHARMAPAGVAVEIFPPRADPLVAAVVSPLPDPEPDEEFRLLPPGAEVRALPPELQPGDLGEGTDEEFEETIQQGVTMDNSDDTKQPEPASPEPDAPAPADRESDFTYPEPPDCTIGSQPTPPIDGADEYRENAKRDGEQKGDQGA